jgi:NAD(P)-dependent dehydrogenase (short-subunit alcohol dehydrogenase family)
MIHYTHVDNVNIEEKCMKTIMITGSTQGLGLEIAKQLASMPNIKVIMAVRNVVKGEQIARTLGPNVSVVQLDLSTLSNVRRFTDNWQTKLDGLINNAGIQMHDKDQFTPESLEETIAVNHLASFQLTMGLEPYLDGGRVLFIGSGTHHPTAAKSFGFRGAQFSSIRELAEGKANSDDILQRNRDRYATSKFLNTITAVELARRNKNYQALVFDPGLMVGTGLARSYHGLSRFLWDHVLPRFQFLLRDASTPQRSAAVAAWLITEPSLGPTENIVFNHHKQASNYVWKEKVFDPALGAAVYEQTVQFLAAHNA